jgi:CBS domain-containing protein
LASVKVSSILPAARKDLITIGEGTNIEDTLKLMADNKILSVPVMRDDLLRGFVDIYEIMTYTAFSNTPLVDWNKPASSLLGTTGNIINDDVQGVWVARELDSLQKPLAWLSKGVRRFLVETDYGWRLVTQSDLVRFLSKTYSKFGIGEISLEEADIIRKPVFRVDPNTKVIDAFKKMRAQEINGLAVTDSDGTLVGTLSESDLRGLTMDTMYRLQHPVIDFLKVQNQLPEVMTVRPDMPLRDLLETMTKQKLHRLFVVDDEEHLTGVVTLTDIIAYFWQLTMGYWFSTE